MSEDSLDEEFADFAAHLLRSSRLSPSEVRRFLGELLHFLDEGPEQFVRRRHFSLQSHGLSNSEIYARLAVELRQRRFRAPEYSLRQLRRIIYG